MTHRFFGICRWTLILVTGFIAAVVTQPCRAETFSIGQTNFLLNGEPFLIRCGEMHFARIPRDYWAQRLRMAHALGLNTVCAYLFWNLHEPEPDHFIFSGDIDIAEFCRLAQAEGLHVILRPGPYSCAEWDFGGLPWWLLKIPNIKVRTDDPRYLAACKNYLQRVGQELAPLQITRGGPIIMVQVENEYGSFGTNKAYMGVIRDDLKAAGFDVPLFTCDGPKQLTNDTRDDLFSVVNIGRNPEKALKVLRGIRPEGPLMIGEYYPGWFDSWGQPHHTAGTSDLLKELTWMLTNNVSFSIYMVHGGTTFGFDAGANDPPFSPESTSYDYDAPISEAGWATPKFESLRDLFSKHLNPGEALPAVPPSEQVITIRPFELKECAPLFANLPHSQKVAHPEPLEDFNQAHGAMLYRTHLPRGAAGQLRIKELHDYGLVFVDGQQLATLDRRKKQSTTWLPARDRESALDLLVDTFGHITYGKNIGDFKGITESVELATHGATNALSNWEVFSLPFDEHELAKLKFKPDATASPAFYRGTFSLDGPTGDTFLDMSSWGKGMVWVNGHNLGRYWNIGPQQTLYCPGPWLKLDNNEMVVLEFNGARQHSITGLARPILDQVNE
jgi:beta-galactosidase